MSLPRSKILALAIAAVGIVPIVHVTQAQPAKSTTKEKRVVGGVSVLGVAGEPEFFVRGRLYIDADGAPNVYHPGYTCDEPGQTGWKLPANLACASKTSAHTCRGHGFDGEVKYGEHGTLVRCEWKSHESKCIAEPDAHHATRRQGGCLPDHESKMGLDDLESAGAPGAWVGILLDKHGNPVLQKAGDPFPGFYISPTSLVDPTRHETDMRRYVDSTKINYVALPPHTGAQAGDLVVVVNWPTKKVAYAVFGDGGSAGYFQGEGSMALASALGYGSSPRSGGTDKHDLVYLVFPGKHLNPRFPKSQGAIDTLGSGEFAAWGGLARLEALAP